MQNTNNLPDMTPASRELINMSSPASSSDTISVAQQAATPPSVPTSAQRAAQLSECFSSIAEQLAHASSLFALPPISVAVESSTGTPQSVCDHQMDLAEVSARLVAIEQTQAVLRADIDAVQRLLAGAQLVDARPGPSEADLETRINEIMDTIKLDQVRLYARLHNAMAVIPKMPIMAPPTSNGKPPPNFPNTKGEFEHLTRERYEAILKAYSQSVKGDTEAKKQALRVFIGLPA